jgi:hypothetical protein
MRTYPSDSAAAPEPIRYTLLAVLQSELVDGPVGLLIGLIRKVSARAERKVEKGLTYGGPRGPARRHG